MEGQLEVPSELIIQLSHEPLSVPERNCSAFFLPAAPRQIKLMPLERLLLVNKSIAENSETLVNPQSQEGLLRILIVLVAAQQSLEDLSESILIFVLTEGPRARARVSVYERALVYFYLRDVSQIE